MWIFGILYITLLYTSLLQIYINSMPTNIFCNLWALDFKTYQESENLIPFATLWIQYWNWRFFCTSSLELFLVWSFRIKEANFSKFADSADQRKLKQGIIETKDIL